MTVMPQNSRKREEDEVAIVKVGGTTLIYTREFIQFLPYRRAQLPWENPRHARDTWP
jgi:hypothetical protein